MSKTSSTEFFFNNETVLAVINRDVALDNCVPTASLGWVCDGMNEKFMKNKQD